MKDPLSNATEIINKVTSIVDDNVYSEQESQSERTERYRIAINSDSWFPKIARPFVTIVVTLVWAYVMINPFDKEIADTVVYSSTGAFSIVSGFYFHSRRVEKINAKKSDAAIKIERMKTRHELREEKRDARAERKK